MTSSLGSITWVQGPTSAMALSREGPSSCTGQVTSHGTCWCPKCGPKGECSHHHHWSPAQWGQWNHWSCLVVLDPKSSCFMFLTQLLVLLASPWEDGWWPCPPPEPHPRSPTATAEGRIPQLWKLQFLTPASPKKQPTKLLWLFSTSPWRTGRLGWVVRQSATALRLLETQDPTWSQWRWQPWWPSTHCGGGLEASCFRLLKLGNLNPLLLLFPLYIQLHILDLWSLNLYWTGVRGSHRRNSPGYFGLHSKGECSFWEKHSVQQGWESYLCILSIKNSRVKMVSERFMAEQRFLFFPRQFSCFIPGVHVSCLHTQTLLFFTFADSIRDLDGFEIKGKLPQCLL